MDGLGPVVVHLLRTPERPADLLLSPVPIWRMLMSATHWDRGHGLTSLHRRGWAVDRVFAAAAIFFGTVVLVLLGAIIVSLMVGAAPALKAFGVSFLWTSEWNPVTQVFGAFVPIYGTLVTSAIAMIIGVPLSVGVAIFLTELCPVALKRPIGLAIELLAAIPSIIYGIWGLFVFAPLFQATAEPLLVDLLGPIPVIGALFSGPPLGIGVLTAGLILAIMVLPYISAIMRDVFDTVPPILKESAYGLGGTRLEVITNVVIPYTRIGMMGGIMLGLGRALGETMAVTFVIGNAHQLSASLMAPGNTISSALANEFTEAVGDIYLSALIALGLILFLITFVVLAFARLLLIRLERQKGT